MKMFELEILKFGPNNTYLDQPNNQKIGLKILLVFKNEPWLELGAQPYAVI